MLIIIRIGDKTNNPTSLKINFMTYFRSQKVHWPNCKNLQPSKAVNKLGQVAAKKKLQGLAPFITRFIRMGIFSSIITSLICLPSYIAAPMIDPSLSSTVKVAVGSVLTLSCTSRGSPPDTFTWRKDSGPIVQSTSITTVTHNSTNAVFRADYSINNVSLSDSGTYTCNVTNPIGSDSETITVIVIGKYTSI